MLRRKPPALVVVAVLAGCGPMVTKGDAASEGFSGTSDGSTGSTDTCGNGMSPEGSEECDDGNTTAGDGCSPTCKLEAALSAGAHHTCARNETGAVRCWGSGGSGQLGYGNTDDIGDDETPASAGDVDVGGDVVELVTGLSHTCARLRNGTVRCWGDGFYGALGYGNTNDVGDDETPASAGDVPVGGIVVELAAGGRHTCARLDTGSVRCWGDGDHGQLGYPGHGQLGVPDSKRIGDDETPASVGDVDVGATVVGLEAGAAGDSTCARLDGGAIRCWGFGVLGYPNAEEQIGDDETPASAGDIDVGGIVVELAAGGVHRCARLDTHAVRCWGVADYGRLGYGNSNRIGDDETPASAGNVDIGGTVVELAAGGHTCARLDSGAIRCWGHGVHGSLGYGNTHNVGDDEMPASAGDVDVGGSVVALTVGHRHTCARLDTGGVRCWGDGEFGSLGYGNTSDIGDDETPADVGEVMVF